MSQIKKSKKKLLTLGLAGASLAGTVAQVSADEDTVVRTSTAGDGVTRYEGTTEGTPVNDVTINQINEEIRLFAQTSGGLVNVSETAITADDKTIGDAKKALERMKTLIAEYRTVKASLDDQYANNIELTGKSNMSETIDGVDITGNTYGEIGVKLRDQIDKMKKLESANNKAINYNANNSTAADDQLQKAVVQANIDIQRMTQTVAHANDGAIGNYDDIRRASEDSAQNTVIKTSTGTTHGVIVNNEATQKINATTTETAIKSVEVENVDMLNKEIAKAHAAIHAAQAANNAKTASIGEYKDNSLENIKEINKWLQTEQDRADNIQDGIQANMTSVAKAEEYKANVIAKLNDLKAYANQQTNAKAKAKMLEDADRAMQVIATQTKLTQSKTASIDVAQNKDFGDIGVRPETIKAEITKVTGEIDAAVATAMDKLKKSNDAANSALTAAEGTADTTIADYKAKVVKFVEDFDRITAENNQITASNNAILAENRKTLESKGLTFTGDYATDKATADKWNLENVGKPGTSTGLKATPNTTYTLISGGSKVSRDPSWALRAHLEGAQHNQNQDIDYDNIFTVPIGGTLQIRVSNTSHGDVDLTFSNFHGWEFDQSAKEAIVTLWDNGSGGIAFGVVISSGIAMSGATHGSVGESGGGAGGYGTYIAMDYIRSFDLAVRTAADDLSTFTYNDVDADQTVTVHQGLSGEVKAGSQLRQSGNSFTSQGAEVSQGSQGVLSSNSFGFTVDNPQRMDVAVTHRRNSTGATSIVGGIFGESSMTEVKPISVRDIAPLKELPEPPEMTVIPVNVTVETFGISDPSAVAHTEGKVNYQVPSYQFSTEPFQDALPVKTTSAKVYMPIFKNVPQNDRIAASSTSFVVRQKPGTEKRTASGNSFVVRPINPEKRTASGNSFKVTVLNNDKRTASGNSFVVRPLPGKGVRTASGNAFTVKVIDSQILTDKGPVTVAQTVIPKALTNIIKGQKGTKPISNPIVSTKTNTVDMTVYTDMSIKPQVEASMQAWQQALAVKNLSLNLKFTTSKDDLKKGVTIAFFDVDNESTRANMGYATIKTDDDKAFEFNSLAGLTVSTSTVQLVDLDSDDKFNRDGSITTGSLLKNANYIIQVNTDNVTDPERQKDVITHEVGHVFGLVHNDSDSLMTTYYDDEDFTGKISDIDATLAAAYIVDKIKR